MAPKSCPRNLYCTTSHPESLYLHEKTAKKETLPRSTRYLNKFLYGGKSFLHLNSLEPFPRLSVFNIRNFNDLLNFVHGVIIFMDSLKPMLTKI